MSLLEHQKLWGKQGKSLGSEFNTRDMWLSHTPRLRRLQPATQQSHFSNRWEQEFHFRHCFYFIYHISSIHLMLTIAGLYGLNIAQHFLECRRYSFLITQDNCSNISLPAWFHMAHHRIQSNKCLCQSSSEKQSESSLKAKPDWTTAKTKLYHVPRTEKLLQLLLLGKQSWSLTLWLQHILRTPIKGQCGLELNTQNSLSLLTKGVLGPGSALGQKAELLRHQNRG